MPKQDILPVLDRVLSWSVSHPFPVWARYLVATLLIAAVGLLRVLVITSAVPWLLFMPAVLGIALLLGRAPGVYAALLATIVAGASIGRVTEPLWMTTPQWTGSILFVLVSVGIAVVVGELRAVFRRAQRLASEKDVTHAQLADREAFLASVLASSTDCIKILDLDARLTFMSEGGQKVMEIGDFNEVAGCPWPDFWQDEGNVEARAAIEDAKAGRSRSFVGRAATMGGTVKWWNVAVSPVLGPDGTPNSILSVSRDITATRENDEERSQLVRLVEKSLDFIGMARCDESMFFMNDAACCLVGLDREAVKTATIADFFPPEEAEAVRSEVLPAVDRDGSWSGERMFRHIQTGELIPVLYTVFRVADHDGAHIGYGTVTRDLRERKQAEDRQHLLNGELSHRLKNVLAVVQSVAAQTLRQADDLASANDALAARLGALAQATDVLTARSWAAADLREVAERALSPHGTIGQRIRLSGPGIILQPQVTMAFALALHELATNAAKYGALSNEDGHVDLTWAVTNGSNASEPRFTLFWQEIGGPTVSPPTRRGFGSKMIERSLRSYFRGPALLDYQPSGVVFKLDAPLGEAGRLVE